MKEYNPINEVMRDQKRMEAFKNVQLLDEKENREQLTDEECMQRKIWQETIKEEDLKREMDWREKLGNYG
jgi:hypothetical protein